MFSDISHQPPGSNRGLIEKYFGSGAALRRAEQTDPRHRGLDDYSGHSRAEGQGLHEVLDVISAMDGACPASDRLCLLWDLNGDEVLHALIERHAADPTTSDTFVRDAQTSEFWSRPPERQRHRRLHRGPAAFDDEYSPWTPYNLSPAQGTTAGTISDLSSATMWVSRGRGDALNPAKE